MSRTQRVRLGRGLGALLGDDALRAGRDDPGLRTIPRARIVPNPFQPRREFDQGELDELIESIRANGLLQPLVVRQDPSGDDRYQLVAGERRLRAITYLEWERVPALVRDVDDQALLVLALVENIQRAELGPMDEAEGYRSLVDDFGLTQGEVAEAVGKSRSTVANMLRLLRLPPSVRRLLSEGELSIGHARALLSLEHPGRISDLARRAAQEGWTVRQVESRTRRRPESGSPSERGRSGGPGSDRDAVIVALERALQGALGTRASVRTGDGESGEIRIPFRSADDFDRIFQIVTGESASGIVG